jgi:hypothetical protein
METNVDSAREAAQRAWQAMVDGGELHTRWSAELDTRRAELDQLRQRVGDALLADPDAGPKLATEQIGLEVQVQQAEQAVAAAAARLPQLRRQALAVQVDMLEARAEALSDAASRHENRTRELLAPLAEHEGTSVDAVSWAGVAKTAQLRQAADQMRAKAREWRRVLAADRPDQEARIAQSLRFPQLELGPLEREHAAL